MNKATHTPGSWKYTCKVLDAGGWQIPKQFITIFTGDHIIAYYDTAGVEYPNDAENEANARLIAAAPKLLKVCEAALKAFRVIYDNTDDEDILARLDCWPLKQLRDAIAEAKKEG